jgi:acetophenone carboxylase
VSAPWRRRLSDLGRGVGKPHAPLFAPVLYGVAAQIEALPPAEVTADPTRLGKCLGELRRVLGTESLVVAAPTAMEVEALGAAVDREVWPPRVTGASASSVIETTEFDELWSGSEALAASLECCKRLSVMQLGESVLLAALTGPATLLAQLLGEGAMSAEAWEFAGRALSALSRQFAQRGVSGILFCERLLPADADAEAWGAALTTIANIARFHRIPALLAFDGAEPAEWPAATIACPSRANEGLIVKPHGLTAQHDPASWESLVGRCGSARAVVTAREVDADCDIETLRQHCEAALAIQDEPA